MISLPYPGGEAVIARDGGKLTVGLAYLAAFGMGERYDALNLKGRTVTCRVEEKFCFQGDKSYCPAPFFWTDTGFGLYVDTCEVTQFAFGETAIDVTLPENADAVAFAGTPA